MNADEVVEKVLPMEGMTWEDFATRKKDRELLKQAILSGVLVPQESKPKRPVSVERLFEFLKGYKELACVDECYLERLAEALLSGVLVPRHNGTDCDVLNCPVCVGNPKPLEEKEKSVEQKIRYRCPSCGGETIVVDACGWLVCSWLNCKDPGLLHRLIESKPKRPVSVERIAEIINSVTCSSYKHGECPRQHDSTHCDDCENLQAKAILAEINEGEGK
jgi:hypothetical protein